MKGIMIGQPESRRIISRLKKVCSILFILSPCGDAVLLGLLFDTLNPLAVRTMGANINRRTMDNIRSAGWRTVKEEHLSSDIVRWIEAKP